MAYHPYLAVPALIGTLFGASYDLSPQAVPTTTPAAVATSAPGAAPATRAHHARHGSRMARALRELGLSAAQKAQIKSAREGYRTSRSSATPETRAQLRSQIENILTPAQRTQFDAAMQHKQRAPVTSSSPTP